MVTAEVDYTQRGVDGKYNKWELIYLPSQWPIRDKIWVVTDVFDVEITIKKEE